jgi:hypothetical protein
MDCEESGWRRPSLDALVTIKLRTSITRMNSIGERGSPCRNPRWWEMGLPGIPFKSTWVEEDVRRPLNMSLQILPKPSFSRTSNRKIHETESKALEMSSFKRILGCFWECKNLAIC